MLMEDATPVQTDELVESFARQIRINQADLVNRIRQSLQETLFTNRAEMRPREVGAIAAEKVEMLISGLPHPELGVEHGVKLCRMGLSIQSVLGLVQATRRFVLATFERDLIPQALDAVDIYQNAVMRGYIEDREKLILSEQERIRGAMQIAIGRFTVEIKDIQAMAQRANEANEFKTRFIARVSHELRTPLGALLGMSEMLQQSVYGPLSPPQLDITQRIIDNTHALERVFTELLDQSQLESGQLRLKQDEFSPKVLAHTVHENNLPLALRKGLTMQLMVDADLPNALFGDKGRIEQILSNLVVNAIKYTQTGGIEMRLSLNGAEQWIMQVKDTGIGISEEDRAFIFEPFRQADESMGRKFGGVGLGLAIVQQLVTAMDGRIEVESKVGDGSTFRVILPLHTKRESG
jgi:signal transduction histidine kinase